jgi:hypothetical protein
LSPPARGALARWTALDIRHKRAWLKACAKLAVARHELSRRPIGTILTSLSNPTHCTSASTEDAQLIGWAIASAGARVPWRSDCLIQAMAAAAWLDELGHGWTLNIGVRRGPGGALEAHAWLASGASVITGNLPDLGSFSPIPLNDFVRSGAGFPGD